MDSLRIDTVSELLAALSKFQFQFGRSSGNDDFVFRGVTDERYPLLPKLFRQYDKETKAEGDLQDCHVSGSVYLSNDEFDMLVHFKKRATAFLPPALQNEYFSLLQYAQHYGVPTRLLDFTTNPLVALYFCCEAKSETDGALWIINASTLSKWQFEEVDGLDPANNSILDWSRETLIDNVMKEITNSSDSEESYPKVQRPVFFMPSYIDQRMSAQESCFLIWGRRHEPLEAMAHPGNFMRLSSLGGRVEIQPDQRFLAKIIIPKQAKRGMIKEIDLLGINERTIFPGLDGIGRYIEKHYRRDHGRGIPI